MKTVTSIRVDIELLTKYKEKGGPDGISLSGFIENKLREYLSATGEINSAPKLDRWERAALASYWRLVEEKRDDEGVNRQHRSFTLREIRHGSGQYPGEVLKGLRGLEEKKILMCDTSLDEKGKPAEFWTRPLPWMTPEEKEKHGFVVKPVGW